MQIEPINKITNEQKDKALVCRHMFFIVRPLQTILVSTLQFLANNAILTSQTQVINIRLFLYFFRKQQMRNGILLPKLF